MREGVVAARRKEPVIGNAVGVSPAQRRETRVESAGRDGDRSHPDVEPQHTVEATCDGVRSDIASKHFVERLTVGRDVDVRDLGARVHPASVRPAIVTSGGVGRRSTVAKAGSSTPCTVRRPG